MDSKVNECHRCSVEHDDPVLDREIEIARCVRKLKNNKTGGTCGRASQVWRVRDDTFATQAFRGGLE